MGGRELRPIAASISGAASGGENLDFLGTSDRFVSGECDFVSEELRFFFLVSSSLQIPRRRIYVSVVDGSSYICQYG